MCTYIHAFCYCIYIHSYVHAFIHMYIHKCIHARIRTYIQTYNTYVHHTYIRTCVRIYLHTYVLLYTYMCLFIQALQHANTSTHTHLNTLPVITILMNTYILFTCTVLCFVVSEEMKWEKIAQKGEIPQAREGPTFW